jgi:hypothetical protein
MQMGRPLDVGVNACAVGRTSQTKVIGDRVDRPGPSVAATVAWASVLREVDPMKTRLRSARPQWAKKLRGRRNPGPRLRCEGAEPAAAGLCGARRAIDGSSTAPTVPAAPRRPRWLLPKRPTMPARIELRRGPRSYPNPATTGRATPQWARSLKPLREATSRDLFPKPGHPQTARTRGRHPRATVVVAHKCRPNAITIMIFRRVGVRKRDEWRSTDGAGRTMAVRKDGEFLATLEQGRFARI